MCVRAQAVFLSSPAGGNFFNSESTRTENPAPFEDLITIASPGRTAPTNGGLQFADVREVLRLRRRGHSVGQRFHFRTGKQDDVRFAVSEFFTQGGMQTFRMPAQLQHVTKYGYPSSAGRNRGRIEEINRGGHRRRVGVVAFIDERENPLWVAKDIPLSAPLRRIEGAQRRCDRIQVRAGQVRGAQDGENILNHMPSGYADPGGQILAGNSCGNHRVVRPQIASEQLELGAHVLAKPDNVFPRRRPAQAG